MSTGALYFRLMNGWYDSLVRPPLTPPDAVFGPVWTVLYIMIAVAIVLYYRSRPRQRLLSTTVILLVHIVTNLAWTTLFFVLKSPSLALVDIVLLDVTLVLLVRRFFAERRLAGLLLLPYLGWVLFATYLNTGFLVLN